MSHHEDFNSGRVTVHLDRSDVEVQVFVGKTHVGTVPGPPVMVSEGDHDLEVRNDNLGLIGHSKVKVAKDKTATVNIKLRPVKGSSRDDDDVVPLPLIGPPATPGRARQAKGSLHDDGGLAGRADQPQPRRMEEVPGQAGEGRAAIEHIAQDGCSDGREVGANLVHHAGVDSNFQQTEVAVALGHPEAGTGGPGLELPGLTLGGGGDHFPGISGGVRERGGRISPSSARGPNVAAMYSLSTVRC